MIADFYSQFEPMIDQTLQQKSEHKVGERILGTDPATGKPVSVKIGRFGPMVQIGIANDTDKPRFAQLGKEQSMQTITLEEALDLFKLPRTLGTFEEKPVVVGTGRFGAYVLHDKKYVSIPKDIDPVTLTLDQATQLILERRQSEQSNHIKAFAEDAELEVMNGRFGPYLKYQGTNYKIPRTIKDPSALTYEQCMEIVNKKTKS
jgi:DNA topoisomerase-1